MKRQSEYISNEIIDKPSAKTKKWMRNLHDKEIKAMIKTCSAKLSEE